jgi:hypothetical protein
MVSKTCSSRIRCKNSLFSIGSLVISVTKVVTLSPLFLLIKSPKSVGQASFGRMRWFSAKKKLTFLGYFFPSFKNMLSYYTFVGVISVLLFFCFSTFSFLSFLNASWANHLAVVFTAAWVRPRLDVIFTCARFFLFVGSIRAHIRTFLFRIC